MKCCGMSSKKRRTVALNLAELNCLQEITRFSLEEIKAIRNRFYRISNTNHRMSKSQFRENMGLLGLETVFFISDRIFDMIDIDHDNFIDLSEFVKYLDVMVNGNQKEKYLLSFRLIDTENKGYFTFNEFSLMISSMVSVWSALTGAQLSLDINKKLEFYIKYIFDEMDQDHNGKITLNNYILSLEKCPDLLEIYDFMNNSFNTQTIFEASVKKYKDQESEKILNQVRILESDLNKFAYYVKDGKLPSRSISPNNKSEDLDDEKIEEIERNRTDRTFKKIDQSVKKLLIRANLDPIHLIARNSYECENIDSEDVSERKISHKMPEIVDISKKNHKLFKAEFQPIFPKIETEDNEKEENMNKNKKEEIFKSNEIKLNNLNNIEKENNTYEINAAIKMLQMQVKNIKEQMELHMLKDRLPDLENGEAEEKSGLRTKSFTIYNVHKPLKQGNSKKANNFGNKGKLVFLGHENWNFVLNMMLGIQMASKSVVVFKDYPLAAKDFKLKYYFELIPRRIKNSKEISKICKFYDYAPYVFHEIRTLFGIKTEDYLKSIGPENMLSNLLKGNLTTLTELVSCGKSGSFFYYSSDGRFTLKTIHRSEFHFLRSILKNYYEYICNNPQTLIIKFFGLHKMRFKFSESMNWKKVYIIIMSNVFHTSKEIHERYDIKGSTYNRLTKDLDASIVQKDLNAIRNKLKLKLTPEKVNILLDQIKSDCSFFEKNQIIDYSLLIGIHHHLSKKNNIEIKRNDSFLSISDIKTGGLKQEEEIGMVSSDGNDEYFIGVIDILTRFNTKKKLEFLFKTVAINKGISAIPPFPYSQRFQNFIKTLVQVSFD